MLGGRPHETSPLGSKWVSRRQQRRSTQRSDRSGQTYQGGMVALPATGCSLAPRSFICVRSGSSESMKMANKAKDHVKSHLQGGLVFCCFRMNEHVCLILFGCVAGWWECGSLLWAPRYFSQQQPQHKKGLQTERAYVQVGWS